MVSSLLFFIDRPQDRLEEDPETCFMFKKMNSARFKSFLIFLLSLTHDRILPLPHVLIS